MAYKEVFFFFSTVTVLLIVEEQCGKKSPVISVQCKIVLDPTDCYRRPSSSSADEQTQYAAQPSTDELPDRNSQDFFFILFGFLKLSYYWNATDRKVQYATQKYKRQHESFLREPHTWKKYFCLDTRLIKSGSHTLKHCTNSHIYTMLLFLVSYDYVLHSTTFSKILGELLILRLTQTKAYRKVPRSRP